MQTEQIERVLVDLVETLEDGNKGFASAAEKMADAGQTAVAEKMREFSTQRARFSTELRSLAATEGIEIRESGSLAGAAHRGWINLKDAVTSDDPHAVLSAAETGEEHAKSEYAKALEADLPDHVKQVIRKQAAAVTTAADDVAALSNRSAG